MRDFTLRAYELLIEALKAKGYGFYHFREFVTLRIPQSAVLRHDVDRYPARAQKMAELEFKMSVRASYHFRVPEYPSASYESAIKSIADLGHEIAYHYEDLGKAARIVGRSFTRVAMRKDPDTLIKIAEESFIKNIAYLRRFYPVNVISMHGDPLSAYDNRDLWKHVNYKDYGVICEPYLDIDYSDVRYFTDTGRRWDAQRSNRRDRITRTPAPGTNSAQSSLASTFDLISRIRSGIINGNIVINTHPQRWSEEIGPWISELVVQNIKNIIKPVLRQKFR